MAYKETREIHAIPVSSGWETWEPPHGEAGGVVVNWRTLANGDSNG